MDDKICVRPVIEVITIWVGNGLLGTTDSFKEGQGVGG
jgi:hypothetical protein